WPPLNSSTRPSRCAPFCPVATWSNFAVIFGTRMRGPLGAIAALAGLLGPPMILITMVRRALRALRRLPGVAPDAGRRRRCGRRIDARHGRQNGAAAVRQPIRGPLQELGRNHPADRDRHFRDDRYPALAAAARSARHRAAEHRRGFSQPGNAAMKSEGGSLVTLAAFFAVTSLFAIGGGNAAIPEMHRYAVDIQHWLSDRQFADSFALAQLTPGPNLIIVTLIGYHVAGIAGAVVATLAMCGPTSVLAFFVGRASQRFTGAAWHGALSRGLIPVMIGLTAQRSSSASASPITIAWRRRS